MQALLLEVLRADGTATRLLDLGMAFLEANEIPMARWERPLRIEMDARQSKAGNTFFDYSQNGLPLPDGLDSKLVLHSVELPWDPVHASKAGHSTRSASAVIVLDGSKYVAKAYISQGKSPFWIKVVAHKQLSTTVKPRGGRLV